MDHLNASAVVQWGLFEPVREAPSSPAKQAKAVLAACHSPMHWPTGRLFVNSWVCLPPDLQHLSACM